MMGTSARAECNERGMVYWEGVGGGGGRLPPGGGGGGDYH